MSHITIRSINIDKSQITVLFNQIWFQEDIIILRQLLLDNVPNLCIKEIIIGADRESTRFQCLNTEFTVQFDYYSQSCWFDSQNPNNTTETQLLFNLLTQNSKRYA